MPTTRVSHLLDTNKQANSTISTLVRYLTKYDEDRYGRSQRHQHPFVPKPDLTAVQFDADGRELDGTYYKQLVSADRSLSQMAGPKSIIFNPTNARSDLHSVALTVSSYTGSNFQDMSQIYWTVGTDSNCVTGVADTRPKSSALLIGFMVRNGSSWSFLQSKAIGRAGNYLEVVKFAQSHFPKLG